MLLNYFEQYLRVRGISENSIGKYTRAIVRINKYLEDYNFPIKNVYTASSIEELDLIKHFLKGNDEFIKQDTKGNRMYSVGFNHFYHFALEDQEFFKDNINKMDVIVPKPQIISTNSSGWKRNQIIISQALEGANYHCEYNNEHHTFTSKATGKEYMEGHHIIPLRYQSEFSNSIDVYANVVCLCPTCHRLIHYGTDQDRKYVAEKMYDERNNRLMSSGIDLSKNDFLKMAASL